jgi:tRNA pseudouridine55 synthase
VDGIILIDKEAGCTSFDIVRRIKSLLKIRKVGHAGTLDPFATGLLIILLGQGTKISSLLMNESKVYLAGIRLGMTTDTLDSTGKIERTKPIPPLSREMIEEGLNSFLGQIDQKPPLYSALRIRGKRAYKLARNGIQFDLAPRRIKIFRIELRSVDLPRLILEVSCSSGTYIRSLAADIGERLGTLGYLESLKRLSSGAFLLRNAYRLTGGGHGDRLRLKERIIPLYSSLPGLKAFSIDDRLVQKIRNGYQPTLREVIHHTDNPCPFHGQMKLVHGRELIATAEFVQPEKGEGEREKLKLTRVFSAQEPSGGRKI